MLFRSRLDNVLVRIRDTRVYIDFKSKKVTREYTATEEKFDAVKEVIYAVIFE